MLQEKSNKLSQTEYSKATNTVHKDTCVDDGYVLIYTSTYLVRVKKMKD